MIFVRSQVQKNTHWKHHCLLNLRGFFQEWISAICFREIVSSFEGIAKLQKTVTQTLWTTKDLLFWKQNNLVEELLARRLKNDVWTMY